MMLELNDEGVLEKVDEEKLVTVDEEELDELINRHNKLHKENEQLKQSYKEFEDECQSTFNAMNRKQNDLYRKNFKLKEENEQLKQQLKTKYIVNKQYEELQKLKEENKELKKEDGLFFGKVFDILLKYQDLFNREMADEVLEELGIELTRWFE